MSLESAKQGSKFLILTLGNAFITFIQWKKLEQQKPQSYG